MVRSVIDPVSRIEGHLRVEVEVTNGKVSDAWVSGGLFRGMEIVMKGRAPSDAYYIAQRICGVCPISHGHASTMSAESALGITIPQGARMVRNIIEAAQYLHSHILWFYGFMALDYIDPAEALKANIANTYALAQQVGTTTSNFKAVQDKLKALVGSGQLSIFTNGWFGHPAYSKKLPPELALIGVAHYLEGLEMQAVAAQVIAVAGGKFPHFMTSIPGGTAFVPTEEKLGDILFRLQQVRDFVWNTMIPDTLAIAPFYTDELAFGGGHGNFLAWGVFNRESMQMKDRYLPDGVIMNKQLAVTDADPTKVAEFTPHSWYAPGSSDGLNPSQGVTQPLFTDYKTDKEYSWAKAARYDGKPMEAGPLSRMLVAYLRGVPEVKSIIDLALTKLGAPGKPEVLISLLGRVAARNLEAAVVADWSLQFVTQLVDAIKGGDVAFFAEPTQSKGSGAGMWEAPRGALGHWMTVGDDGKISEYQVVTPSTWDNGPRDDKGVRGVAEEALIGTPILDATKPLEAVRIIHSFDP